MTPTGLSHMTMPQMSKLARSGVAKSQGCVRAELCNDTFAYFIGAKTRAEFEGVGVRQRILPCALVRTV